MDDELEPVKAFFPATAMPDADWWNALWPDPQAVVRALGVESGMRVLDLCCGDGHFTAALAAVVGPLGRVWGADLDDDLLDAARLRIEKSGAAGWVDWRVMDACDLKDIAEAPLDAVFLANTFHGVPDKGGLARAVREVLGADGAFIIVNWHKKEREETPVLGQPRGPRGELRMTPEQTVGVVLPQGFTLHGVVDVGPYHYGAVFTKLRGL
ncbi:class I SAM-dependent methyltransferase [Varunaivibrio sulfuroxidans]|uniref:Methyltransferase family protein n=1 Tax=Varunaivibrio sulfuroxidans TaxID=1773489 RepID=A0A4R3JD32_9PROT|nr:class I SAM-dependent methyltransferase [Varunaivibrio sulfuroxidans]TCS63584.1 methyltransferase family protein [Varunaivibrio sulfuroxidans]WES30273.1 class I SAM-dependent methyltransferase [Varunaivibrio sulfuroxidans]